MKRILFLISAVILVLCLTSCSSKNVDVKCGTYRSENSELVVEVKEGNKIEFSNYDFSDYEKILEDNTIRIAGLNESDSELLREKIDLNRDCIGKELTYELDKEMYEHEGFISIVLPIDNPFESGVSNWGLSYYPSNEELVLSAQDFETGDTVEEIVTLEK